MSADLGPDFFIVGAPKCGTTAMDAYLAQHPEIFMIPKEQHYFGEDLEEIWRHPDAGTHPSAEQYFALFAGSEGAVRRGDSSVWYLWSRTAARELHDHNPDARIIVMLRNPVDMLASLHSQSLLNGVEDIEDFEEAVAAEPDRRAGRRVPPNNGPVPWRLFYSELARFHDQVERYFVTFGRDQVHVILYDDLVADTPRTYRGVLEFLGVDPEFAPDFEVINANKRLRSRWLQQRVWNIEQDASALRRLGTALLPHPIRSALLRRVVPALRRFNTESTRRQPVSPEVRNRLYEELARDIEKLSVLLDRDLSHWGAGIRTGRTPAHAARPT